MNRYFLVFSFLILSCGAFAQDLSNLSEGPQFKVTGGLSVNQIGYFSNAAESRRDPYNFFLGGNLTLSAYGLSIPLSFAYSNQNFSLSQPFNQFGLRPTYKWVQGYLGYNSLNFSKYTLAGHIFNGAGVKVSPEGPISATVMYGRLQKAVIPDSTQAGSAAAFRRMGWGGQVVYTADQGRYEISLFGAADDPNSLPIAVLDSATNLTPQQNLAIGIKVNQTLFKVLNLEVEYGNSALTQDQRAAPDAGRPGVEQPLAWAGTAYLRNSSTAYYQAIRGSLSTQIKSTQVGLAYERIDPGYATLGAYFFNQDFENITGNVATSFWEKKINLSASLGVQKDNLSNDQVAQTTRWVGSANVSGQLSPTLNVSANYSNFQSFARIQSQDQFQYVNSLTQFDPNVIDTLSFVQVNQSAGLTASWVLNDQAERPKALVMSGNYSRSADNNPGSAGSDFYNLSAAYSFQDQTAGFGLTAGANATLTQVDTLKTQQLGPTLSANQTFLENQLKLTASFASNVRLGSALPAAWVHTLRIAANYQLFERHQFRLNTSILNRESNTSANRLTEVTANLGYSFAF